MDGQTAPHQANGWATRLDPAYQEILDQADKYARKKLYPLAQKMDDEEWWPETFFTDLAEVGFLGINAPEEYGGLGADYLTTGLIAQAFGRWNHALGLSWVVHENLFLTNLVANGSEEQKARFVPKLCTGEYVGALGLTEPGAGSDALGSMSTKAVRDGDDYIINGSKIYITNGPVADVVLVYAKTDPSAGSKGISAFIVETATPGFKVAQKLAKMGWRGSQTAELVLEDMRVPASNRIRAENEGVKVVMSGLDLERAMISPLCLGICERALEISLDYAKTRTQFGKPIASFQMIQSRLADMYVSVETMRAYTYQVLARCGEIGHGEGGRGEIHAQTAASILYAANTMNRVLDNAVQIHGGSGYIWGSEINRLFRATKLMEIGAGTTEVRKLIISGELLK